MQDLIDWLAGTRISLELQDVLWIVPAIQSVHLVAVAVVLSSVLMLGLRLSRLASLYLTIRQAADRYFPWIWTALAVLAGTGAVLIVAEPGRTLPNPSFWVKMALLAAVLTIAIGMRIAIRHPPEVRGTVARLGNLTRVLVTANFALWCAVAVAGRWIAYTKVGT